MQPDVGLALSGGGSRAAAFHRGTVRALAELGIVPRIKTLSSVSGGSVFAAAWLAARARGKTDEQFLAWMGDVLERGFIRPALLHWRALKLLWPGWSRTHRIAETFDEILFDKLSWSDLPATPLLCLNTTNLNNAGSGRFSQTGYSGEGVGELVGDSYQEGTVKDATIGFATAASAAFPFGLPPLSIARERFAFPLANSLDGCSNLMFTDGGILENLGIERLLHSHKFETPHVISSDAGLRDRTWKPGGIVGRTRSALIFALSSEILERLLLVMNDKQNKSMRELLYARLLATPEKGRRVLYVRLQQNWADLLHDATGPELAKAREIYDAMGGDAAAKRANDVATSFGALSRDTLDLLEAHARWQVHASTAVYANDLLPRDLRSD